MNSALCQSFQELAAQTWRRLEAAHNTGLFWSEETNTETILMELLARHPAELRVVSFNKIREAKNGADWEWWIGGSGRWFGMRVQAKRISLPREEFYRLHQQRPKGSPDLQIDTLINAARADGLTPAYCMYVFSRRVGFWPCIPSLAYGNISPSGCLIGHAQAIKSVRSNSLSRLAHVLLPWHLLVCSCNAATGPSVSPADVAEGVLNTSATIGSMLDPAGKDDRTVVVLFPPRDSLPSYVSPLSDQAGADRESIRRVVYRESNAEERRIGGIVVVQAEPR